MRRTAALLTTLVAAGSIGLIAAGPASALGGERLVCRVSPSRTAAFTPSCGNNMPASSYTVGFAVQNETAPSSYSWSVSSAYPVKVSSGCTATSNYCNVTLPNTDADVVGSVTLTQGGTSETLTSYASIGRYCGTVFCG